MYSKVKFDLDSQDEAVISAGIVPSSHDVRDKIARTFIERLGYESNLALIQFLPDTECDGEQYGRKGLFGQKNIVIKTFGANDEKTCLKRLVEQLCTDQLNDLLELIPIVLNKRSSGTPENPVKMHFADSDVLRRKEFLK